MEIKVVLPCTHTLLISNVNIFSDYSVGIDKHIESYTAILEGTFPPQEIEYESLTEEETYIVEKAIWDEYYKIEAEQFEKYGRNPEFDDLVFS